MRTATVEEAKQQLEELIEAARAGETVEITEDGRPLVSLVAASSPHPRPRRLSPEEWQARLASLEAEGLITPPRGGKKPTFSRLPEPVEASGVLDALLEERREGR